MNICYEIDPTRKTGTGKPIIRFFCDECGEDQDEYVLSSYYNSEMVYTLPKAEKLRLLDEYTERLNTDDLDDLFSSPKVAPLLRSKLCNCGEHADRIPAIEAALQKKKEPPESASANPGEAKKVAQALDAFEKRMVSAEADIQRCQAMVAEKGDLKDFGERLTQMEALLQSNKTAVVRIVAKDMVRETAIEKLLRRLTDMEERLSLRDVTTNEPI